MAGVWIARDGDGMLSEFRMKPHWLAHREAYDVDHGGFVRVLTRDAFPSIKPGECIKFVHAERYVNGETIAIRIAAVVNEKREWNATGWSLDGATTSDEHMLANADFIAASRSDKSAAHVERLVREVRRLKDVMRQYIPQPHAYMMYHLDRWSQTSSGDGCRLGSEAAVYACHIHGVEVPPHLKPYQENADG